MSDGWETKCAVKAALPFTSGATPLEINSESLKKTTKILNPKAMSGSRSQKSERSRYGTSPVGGNINLPWSPTSGAILLPWIMGANASGTTFALAETLQTFQAQMDRGANVFNYTDLLVNKAMWKGATDDFVNLDLDLIGVDEVLVGAGGGQALTAPTDPPYVFSDISIVVAGTTRSIFDIEMGIDNMLAARFANSRTATRISPTDLREVPVSFTTPFTSSELDLYNTALAGISVVVVMTNGNYSTTFTFACVQFPSESPVSASKGEIPTKMNGVARMTGSTRELVITHDSTN